MNNATDITRADKIALAKIEDVGRYVEGSRSVGTWRAYASDWGRFADFCQLNNLQAFPASPETVARFLVGEKDLGAKASTLERRLAAISVKHKGSGHASPCSSELVRSVLSGIRREIGTRPDKKKPVRVGDVRRMVAALGDSTIDKRNRAMILLGYAGAFRRSELVALDVADLDFVGEGVKVLLRFSKTDQEGRGMVKHIPYGSTLETCPVRSLQSWLSHAQIKDGAIFRQVSKVGRVSVERLGPKGVARTVKRMAASIGLDAEDFSGHSLRSGLITDGYAVGVAESDIMAMSGHKSREVLNGYRQEADGFRRNVAGSVGL